MLPPKLILAPIDFSDPSHAAMNIAADMASRFGAELLLVHVEPAIQNLPADVSILKERAFDEGLTADAAKRLTDLAATLAPKNIKVRTELGSANDVGMELVRSAARNNVDMVVIATHGMTGWRKFAFGSVAEIVVKQASCPVLLLRANPAAHVDSDRKSVSAASS
jgi:nucleotide-binding universal stress UspA family protein